MVIDTSALIAILLKEPEQELFLQLMEDADHRLVSAATVLETSMVIERRKNLPVEPRVDELLQTGECTIMPVTAEQVNVGRNAFRLYGKGRHAAGLNFGDCFAYALAKVTGEPLLFKGNDFSLTDITPAAR